MDDFQFRAVLQRRGPAEPSIREGGLLKLKPASPEYAQLITTKLSGYKGEEVQVEISAGDSWSDRMNRLFHALVRKILSNDATQYWQLLGKAPSGFEEIREWAKVQFGGAEVKIVGSLSFIESWKDFSKRRATQTIDNMLVYMMEQGIDIDAEKLEHDSIGGSNG